MKRIIPLILFVFALAFGAWAQTNPNRVIVVEKSGYYKGYLCERIDSLFFTQIEGRVAADVEFKEFKTGAEGDTIMLGITMTEECQSYKIAVIPANRMSWLNNEVDLAAYIDNNVEMRYYNGFNNAEMTGFDFQFQANAEYTIATLGYDIYGIPCSTSTASFTTPAPAIAGNPYVEAKVDEVTADSFTISFTPNSDVSSYSMCSFNAGTAEEQFAMFGAWMGFSSIAEMVYAWGIPQTGPYTHTWTAMSPGTDYEVLVAVKDANGNFADIISVPVSTTKLGGTGLSEIDIEIGDFGGTPDGYWQEVICNPNSETSVFHVLLVEEKAYEADWNEERVLEYLKSDTDPYNPWNTWWDVFGYDCGYWGVDPETTYLVFAIGKNINNEWGTLATAKFTTPAVEQGEEEGTRAPMAKRIVKGSSAGITRPILPVNMKPAHKGIILK